MNFASQQMNLSTENNNNKKKKKKKNMLTWEPFKLKGKENVFLVVNTHNSRIAQCTILYLLVRQIQCHAYSRRIPALVF